MIVHLLRNSLALLCVLSVISCMAPTGTLPDTQPPAASGPVSLSVTTESANGSYAPRHVLALWVEDSSGAFVRTLGVWAKTRKSHLSVWGSKTSVVDGVTGATIGQHGAKTVSWDLKNAKGVVQPFGTYHLRGEMTESNSGSKTFSVTLNIADATTPVAKTTASASGFKAITTSYTP